MAYLHINNLYKEQDILMFKECYAMEKIHGTSAYISFKNGRVSFFAGGGDHKTFLALFDKEFLSQKFLEVSPPDKSVLIYGEFYGGKLQRMRETYGDIQKFIVFEVKIGDAWLNVPNAEKFVKNFNLEFVHYKRIPATIEEIEAQMLAPSVQAVRNGMGENKAREGVVLRPIEEVVKNNGERIIAKHKNPIFSETKTIRNVNESQRLVLEEASKIADEWVTLNRLKNILSHFENVGIENTGEIIKVMIEDVIREGAGEIADSKELRRILGKRIAQLFKQYLGSILNG